MAKILREMALSKPVTEWLESQGYTVYTEVCPPFSSAHCTDLYGDKNGIYAAIELKMSLTEHVIQQAYLALLYTHYVYCAVPTRPRNKNCSICQKFGIGVLMVTDEDVRCIVEPKFNDVNVFHGHYVKRMAERLALMEPGGIGGKPCLKGEGPVQAISKNVKKYIAEHHPKTWGEIFNNVANYYANAKSMASVMRNRFGIYLNK